MPFWSWGPLQQAHSASMQEDAEKAMHNLRRALTTLMDFGALNESAQTDLSDVHHPWFNTAAGAYARALTRMLVYPKDDQIMLLPGIPAGWQEFSFELPVHRGGVIKVEVQAGVFANIALTESRQQAETRMIHLPARYLADGTAFAEEVDVIQKSDEKTILRVQTAKGALELLR